MKQKATFAEWLKAYGIPAVARDLNVTPRTAYYWLTGKVKPGAGNAEKIMTIAPHLSLNDILGIRGGSR